MTLRHFKAALSALVFAGLAACGTAPGKCSTNTDCATGTCDTGSGFCVATCGNTVCGATEMCSNSVCIPAGCASHCTTGQTCEHLDAGFACVQTDCFPACDSTYQECNQSATPPACVATTCHPACGINEECKPGDGGFTCNPLTAGAIVVTQPTANLVTGVVTPLAISATAGAPNGGPTKVKLAVEQPSSDAGASLELTTGNSGVYSGNVSLADAGFQTGNANVVGTVFYRLSDGGTTSIDSPAIPIQIDVDPPAFGAPVYDKPFYSGVASPAQTANVTIPINDVGPANVKPSSVILTSGTHQYPAISTAYPDGGNGNYLFAVTASDLSSSTTFLGPVPYSVTATDNVGNASTLSTGNIALDNIPPAFDSPRYDAGWYGGDAGISISVNVQDQAGGSGLDGGSLAISIGGITLSAPAFSGTDTYTFSTTGAAIRQGGQGPVLFNFIAADNAGNVSVVDGGQILVDEQAPTLGATAVGNGTAHATSSGWFAQDGGTLQVTTIVNDSNGSGPASASLMVGSNAPLTSSSGTVVSSGTSFSFTVPTSVQSAGSETPIALAVSGTDLVGNTSASAGATDSSGNAVTLLIDGKPPLIAPVAFTTQPDGTDANGVHWFSQVGGTINFTATITDNGSLVNPSSVALQTLAGASIGVSGSAAGNVYTFAVPRVSSTAGLIAAGAQGLVSLQIVAKDNVGNTSTLAVAPFGIDGQKPTVSFSSVLTGGKLTATTAPAYPSTGSGCGVGVDFCGHDAAGHYWRKGETTNKLTFYGNDGANGSSIPPSVTNAACSIATSADCKNLEYVATNGSATVSFDTVPDFSTAPFSSAADGTGTIGVTVTVKDLVGNSSSTTVAVNVTRVKWIKKFGSQVISFSGSPIVTSTPTPQIIFAGTKQTTNGPIASFDPTGALLWQAGGTQGITGVTSNMAYSPVTKTLYVVPSGTPTNGYAYLVPASGAPVSFANFGGASDKLGGSPAIVVGPDQTEYVLASDNSATPALRRLEQYACTPASGGASCTFFTSASSTWTSLTSPTTDGTNVYLGHDTTLTKIPFTNGALGTPVDSLSAARVLGDIAIAGSLFFGDSRVASERYRKFSIGAAGIGPVEDAAWVANTSSGAGTGGAIATPPVISGSYVFGSFDNTDGHLYGYSLAAGSSTASGFIYPTSSSTNLGNISPVAIGKDSSVYFTDDANSELVALTVSNNTPTAAWKFTGNSTASISSVTGEPTIDGSLANAGTIYFGDAAGNVFALITDSGGPLAPTAGSNWPRVGFDNCNSGNTSFGCQ